MSRQHQDLAPCPTVKELKELLTWARDNMLEYDYRDQCISCQAGVAFPCDEDCEVVRWYKRLEKALK